MFRPARVLPRFTLEHTASVVADVPYIVARGRKGGSNVAACICNALLYIASNNERLYM